MKIIKISNNKGITLISLVITIIVLLILAAVTLSLTLGNNGIFKTAEKAGENYLGAQEKELSDLATLEERLQSITDGLRFTSGGTTQENSSEQGTGTNTEEGNGTETVEVSREELEELKTVILAQNDLITALSSAVQEQNNTISGLETRLSNVYTKTESNNVYAAKNDVYTKTEASNAYVAKSDVYTKTEADEKYSTKSTSTSLSTQLTSLQGTVDNLNTSVGTLNTEVAKKRFKTLWTANQKTFSTGTITLNENMTNFDFLIFDTGGADGTTNFGSFTVSVGLLNFSASSSKALWQNLGNNGYVAFYKSANNKIEVTSNSFVKDNVTKNGYITGVYGVKL